MKSHDFVVVGAGIIGLSTAYKLKQTVADAKILVIDKEPHEAFHQTGRNSGVIHSGLYYKPCSYKAKLCVQGYRQLIDFAESHDVPYKICGKLVVANGPLEEQRLETLRQRGLANGLEGLKLLNQEEATEYEPFVRASKALWVPQTGVINYKQVCTALVRWLRDHDVNVRFSTKLISIQNASSGVGLVTDSDFIRAKRVVNCAGLHSDTVSAMDPESTQQDVKILPFRGEYYDLVESAAHKVKGLIYPVPDPAFPFLGVHLTRGIDGHVEAGPNAVLALAKEGYTWLDVNIDEVFETLTWPGFWRLVSRYWRTGLEEQWRSLNKAAFIASVQQLLPSIQLEDFVRGGAGVRAQANSRCTELLDDFEFSRSNRIFHVLNAPSPAATSSLAIAEVVVSCLQ